MDSIDDNIVLKRFLNSLNKLSSYRYMLTSVVNNFKNNLRKKTSIINLIRNSKTKYWKTKRECLWIT